MRQSRIGAGPGVLASLLLLCPALMIGAQADPRHGGGGGGPAPAAPHAAPAPHVSAPAPAPHFSAPAPHVSAPAPHFAAPAPHAAPHFAAPHVAAPHVAAPHMAAPHIAPHAAPHVAAPRVPHGPGPRMAAPHAAPHPHVAAPHVAPNRGAPAVAHGRHGPSAPNVAKSHENRGHENRGHENRGLAARPSTETPGNRHALAPVNQPHNAPNATVGNAPNKGPNRQRGNASPSTVGQGVAGPGRNAAGALQQNTRTTGQNARGSRVLTNPVLANAPRRDAASRSLARSTFRGHFAQSPWARDFARDRRHHRHSGIVLGFVGPVFWPYAYDDFIDYTFWPAAYDDFWPYAYDDVFEGIYGGYAPDYGTYYAGGGSYGESYVGGSASSRRGQRRVAARGTGGTNLPQAPLVCGGNVNGLTDFPIERIAQQVQPDQTQQGLLDELKAATEKAVQILQAACPTDLPATPTGRLAALRTRDETMLQAVQVIRPALEKFYEALGDEQKERFNALDQQSVVATSGSGGRGQSSQDVSQLCNRRQSPMAGLPVDLIRKSLHLSDAQNAALQQLTDASSKAAQILNDSCSTDQALTPPGRLGAIEQRLQAMLQAIDTVQPALEHFYTSLSDEQKARFDRIGVRPT